MKIPEKNKNQPPASIAAGKNIFKLEEDTYSFYRINNHLLIDGLLLDAESGMVPYRTLLSANKLLAGMLRKSEERYRIVADHTFDFESWFDTEGRYLYASPSCRRIYGCEPAMFLNDPGFRHRTIFPEDIAVFDNHVDSVEKKQIPGEIEFRIIHGDGSIRWIGHACLPVFGNHGDYLGVRCSDREITCHKRIEDEQSKTLTRVREVNRDLNEFAYAVSHDLKAPLRAVSVLADWIANDCVEKLDNDARHSLDMLICRIRRMHDLMGYSNIHGWDNHRGHSPKQKFGQSSITPSISLRPPME